MYVPYLYLFASEPTRIVVFNAMDVGHLSCLWKLYGIFTEVSQKLLILSIGFVVLLVASYLLVIQGKMQMLRHPKERSWHESKLRDKYYCFI